jgi:hypothetical protein
LLVWKTAVIQWDDLRSIVANKTDYLFRLNAAIMQRYDCAAAWRDTVAVHEVSQGQTVWRGDVEIFDLAGHPTASVCYAWCQPDTDKGKRTITVLEIPPVASPETAVRASIAADKQAKS